MKKYIVLDKVLFVAVKIIFAIAMIATVLAALTTFGSLFRAEIEFSDAVKFLGLCIFSWVCFVILNKIKNRIDKNKRN